MIHVEAPNEAPDGDYTSSTFLAGGITDCPDWQSELIGKLEYSSQLLFNPRRRDFDVRDPKQSLIQIEWEHKYLTLAKKISFWFCAATLCPITLYELGFWSARPKHIVIGIEPGYKREIDVRVQTGLCRPGLTIVDSLDALAKEICAT